MGTIEAMQTDAGAGPSSSAAAAAAAVSAAKLVGGRVDRVTDGRDAPWVEKYRPKSLDDVAAHREIISTIRKLTEENRLPHLLLYGPPGTGKTSTILAVARTIYGPAMANMTLELNASDDRGIDVVRQQVQDFASTRSVFSSRFKLVILDECDAMTKEAQMALRRVIEKYARNTRFCLICNYVSKVIPALQSRCTRFRFPPLSPEHVRERLQIVVDAEGVKLGPGGMDALVRLGCGDMRRTLNVLQSCCMANDVVDERAVYMTTGSPLPSDIADALDWLLNEDFATAFASIRQLQVERGVALVDVVRELHPYMYSLKALPPRVRIALVEKLADIEHRLAFGCSEALQVGALVAAFALVRDEIAAAAV